MISYYRVITCNLQYSNTVQSASLCMVNNWSIDTYVRSIIRTRGQQLSDTCSTFVASSRATRLLRIDHRKNTLLRSVRTFFHLVQVPSLNDLRVRSYGSSTFSGQ